MKVNANHRLVGNKNRQVPNDESPNGGTLLSGGAPRFLILHYTAGASGSGAIGWFNNPAAKASAHLVIDRNGAITQMMPFNRVAWHAGRSSWKGINGLNSHSVGIEIVNWGLLHGSAGAWRSWTGASVPDARAVLKRHKNFEPTRINAWEVFDEDQLDATVAAAAAIVTKYGIPEENVLGHDDISPLRKQDPGPAFDMDAFRAKVFGGSNDSGTTMRVESPTGLRLRSGPGTTFPSIATLPDGTPVAPMGSDGAWVEVTTLNAAGKQDKTGWVHGNWLA
ncbi:N-acetylmuramoyl-L-alanine amidase [Mesorhizobium sp. LHD-90]|uniref:N-acetylmuramoyl-L-alanine amidase n=1 Tax=Mesorhizobium sp. LHD-90 TaxID=3071414 RepID=UPI0027DF6E59|nr:N-acetylmuramoyl-L-alanine amidase [Mesorhizobium sp. LHD-90]MDQ6434503.1 N-acetylmuramoyl-L-alanine amidase [Mesorhizobium sp. LHD-90]